LRGIRDHGRALYLRLRRLSITEAEERLEFRIHVILEGGFGGVAVCGHTVVASTEVGVEGGASGAKSW